MSEWVHPRMSDDPAFSVGFTGKCRCGRTKRPEEMLEVRTLGVGEAFLCVPCVEDLLRTDQVDHLTLHRRAGAPQAWLDAFDAKLRKGPLRHGLPKEIWGEIYARELDKAAKLKPGG